MNSKFSALLLNHLHVVLLLQGHVSERKKKRSWSNKIRLSSSITYLPLVQVVLFRLVLLHQIIQDFLQPVLISLQCGNNILDCSLHQDSVYESEALAIFGQRFQSVQDEPMTLASDIVGGEIRPEQRAGPDQRGG
jgi:glycopeptide antibiotics resistance protein